MLDFRNEPAFPVRGYMLDVSRDRVPTRETLDRLVGVLSLARYNHLQLYVEHTYAFEGHEAVWADASPLTGADLEWLDDRCRQAGMELVVNQNTFGHMERWLKHADYRHRGVSPEVSTLAPTPDNAAFAVDLVRQQLAHVRSHTVNIGCDETWELRGKGEEYVEHVLRIARPLIDDGYHVLFWGDVIASHPELIDRLPTDGMTALAWNYEGRFPFDGTVKPFVDAGFPYWVCPGTSSWNSLVGRIDNAMANLRDAATTGRANGASGYLVTDWGDNGHFQPPSVSFGPIVYGGAVAWDPDANKDLDVPSILDEFVFEDDTHILGASLDRLGRLWNRTGMRAINGSPLQAALCPAQHHFVKGEPDPSAVRDVIDEIDAVLDRLPRARPQCSDGDLVVRELTVAAQLARHGAHRLLGNATDLGDLLDDYEEVWLARSRPGGLADSRRHLSTATSTPSRPR